MSTVLDRPETIVDNDTVLLRAADLIEERGHTKGGKGMPWNADHNGRLCILGAILEARRELGIPIPSRFDFEAAQESAGLVLGCTAFEAWHWNDRHDTTAADVVARLRAEARA